jgi:hypothetical protein
MSHPGHVAVQGAALLVGAALGTLAVTGWTVQGGTGEPPAVLTLATARSSQLDIQPSIAPASRRVEAGGRAVVLPWRLFNATGGPLVVRTHAERPQPELDGSLMLRLRLGAQTLFEGTLGDLLRRGSRPFRLDSHERARVSVRAWVPATARDYGAWDEEITLRFDTTPPRAPA